LRSETKRSLLGDFSTKNAVSAHCFSRSFAEILS